MRVGTYSASRLFWTVIARRPLAWRRSDVPTSASARGKLRERGDLSRFRSYGIPTLTAFARNDVKGRVRLVGLCNSMIRHSIDRQDERWESRNCSHHLSPA